ncbi:MAG: hypothetical protein A2W90_12315 [Bacteroidetes bacterium GWF2_42_66]|nr:MAG: hypothetical protein A2W92_23110 [Bacteroidetes bacterium GWA2_42_15]OFX99971.1 MAG: hypothetical protein A2W89_17300 [Bacteroidetes bacterium GWE2_42_39]OFY40156.1 MAG: hypothetical protein A2W90_12315 [Bacteroidetes bacterium GWF2_42_66]HBL73984.1 DUF1343 domain-containing protein [Prolixibacteraceae bacterium]HCR89205.1 DUF1343 domain-containing protein [Prolixibacteraceae bacterium]
MNWIPIIVLSVILFSSCHSFGQNLATGAEQPEQYLNRLKDKKIGLVINHTSFVGDQNLTDFLLEKKMNIVTIFAPEHGFRGNAAPGEKVNDQIDKKTGVPVVSLYGKTRKPTPEMMKEIDILIFDIQDVGCRFYTYISTLHYAMEACAENGKKLLVLDRPNPNGDYVAGAILKPEFKSFVGMHPIPVVHGCTVGELALMINGEGWLEGGKKCKLEIIKVKNYRHSDRYSLPVKPSPNLPNDLSVRLYPSLCFFEATNVSIGRGTGFPFQVIGYPNESMGSFTFTPENLPEIATNPKQQGKLCYGIDFREEKDIPAFTLKYFIGWYNKFQNEKDFISSERWLNLLSGSDEFLKMIRENKTEEEILKSWQSGLDAYKIIRKKYLLYPDFE